MRKKIVLHIIFWLIYVTLCSLITYINNPQTVFSDQFTKYFLSIGLFYYVVYLLASFKKAGELILGFAFGISFYYGLRFVTYKYLLTSLFAYPDIERIDVKFFVSSIWWWMHYSVYAWFYWYYKKNIHSLIHLNTLTKENSELQSQNLRLQNEKLKAEYNFLKAQINPHFLYNTLNFFYAKTATTDPKTAEGISLLTDIMRYSLQEGGPDSKVPLKDEIAHLKDYINLQQMRFNNTLNILFKDEVRAADCRVLPHIFITLVENAFKHGEINNPMYPLEISLTEKDDQLLFSVRNKIRNGPVDSQSTGVGLNNIRSRLKMEYGDAARLENSQTEDYFAVNFYVPFALLGRPPLKQEDQAGTNPVSFITQKIAL